MDFKAFTNIVHGINDKVCYHIPSLTLYKQTKSNTLVDGIEQIRLYIQTITSTYIDKPSLDHKLLNSTVHAIDRC